MTPRSESLLVAIFLTIATASVLALFVWLASSGMCARLDSLGQPYVVECEP